MPRSALADLPLQFQPVRASDLDGTPHSASVELLSFVALGGVVLFAAAEVLSAATGTALLYNNAAYLWLVSLLGLVRWCLCVLARCWGFHNSNNWC